MSVGWGLGFARSALIGLVSLAGDGFARSVLVGGVLAVGDGLAEWVALFGRWLRDGRRIGLTKLSLLAERFRAMGLDCGKVGGCRGLAFTWPRIAGAVRS